jgi:dCMP deaminase
MLRDGDKAMLDKWDLRYLKLARDVASWSKDPRSKVGSAIVDGEKDRVIALGFNGFPAGVKDNDRLNCSMQKNEMVVHAEQNALLYAGRMARGGSIYIAGKPPCARCAVLIIQAGIKRVVARAPDTESQDKWDVSGRLALKMFEESEVAFVDASEYDEGKIEADEFSDMEREKVEA